jgi:hypothetical protein
LGIPLAQPRLCKRSNKFTDEFFQRARDNSDSREYKELKMYREHDGVTSLSNDMWVETLGRYCVMLGQSLGIDKHPESCGESVSLPSLAFEMPYDPK